MRYRNYLYLLRVMIWHDIESHYKGTVAGKLWLVISQLMQIATFTFVFSYLLKLKTNIKGAHEDIYTYGIWFFAGLLPWTAFSAGITRASVSVINQVNLVKRVIFPLEIIPLVPIISVFIESLVGFAVLVVAALLVLKVFHFAMILLPVVWIAQLLFTAGIGYMLAGFTVFLRDIPRATEVLIHLWFFFTPIAYPVSVFSDQLRRLSFCLNPLALYSQMYRELVLSGSSAYWREFVWMFAVSLVVFLIGFGFYKRASINFSEGV
ncbi:MAG: ABC transporter permease [Candidatus Omnitrophica bacterium]|nr:ABC transporter permease [Candidatus Omnitrophota bacterium]